MAGEDQLRLARADLFGPRREALDAVARFEDALAHAGPSVPHAARELRRLLVEGLRELRPDRIPTGWL
jgi:hypothetical protein